MAKRLVYVVAPLLFGACAPDLPRELYADDRFNAQEEADVVAMIDELNKTGQELLGRDLISYRGRHVDGNGWDLDDAADPYNVIYKVLREDGNYDFITSQDPPDNGGYVAGLGLYHDILIYDFTLFHARQDGQNWQWCVSPFLHAKYEEAEREAEAEGETNVSHVDDWAVTADDCTAAGYPLHSPGFRSVVLHEMGHFIGLAHLNDKEALMYPISNGKTSLTDLDKKALCCVYECVTDKYECEMP